VKIGVGLLPYVWIGSVWQKRRPVITNLSAYRGHVSIDATSLRMVALGMATSRDNAIPRSSYLFGASWPNVPLRRSWGAAPSILQQTTCIHSGFCVIRK
jgi:hypothetical protein